MLENENTLKQEIDSSYEAVSSESKQLLEALQKPLIAGDDRDTPEFSEAASHVMELFLNVHEHNRQLGVLWDAKQSTLREQIHLLSLDQDIAQVSADAKLINVYTPQIVATISCLNTCYVMSIAYEMSLCCLPLTFFLRNCSKVRKSWLIINS